MKKILHIIPGWEDTCRRKAYRQLADVAREKGYEVVFNDVDWKKPLSPQVFPVHKDAAVFGFSLGAILAWLTAQEYPCRHVILASMTPHYSFMDRKIKKALVDLAGSRFVDDIIDNLAPEHHAKKQTILYGDREDEPADILVPDTDHELTPKYIAAVARIL